MNAVLAELGSIESAREFKRSEEALDKLLYDVSVVIARAVSDSVKVPGNDPLPSAGCGSGGCGNGCSCGG